MGHKDLGKRNYNPSLAAQGTKSGKSYLDRIRKMDPYERLLYWIKERQAIHCRQYPKGMDCFLKEHPDAPFSEKGYRAYLTGKPWTNDPIFQNVFFCNVYRENDKVTSYLRDNYRQPNAEEGHVFLGTILLRWYNYIPTMQLLINSKIPHSFRPFDAKRHRHAKATGSFTDGWALKPYLKLLLAVRHNNGSSKEGQLFGGAYIIRPIVDGDKGARKVESIGDLMTSMARDKRLYDELCGTIGRPNARLPENHREPLDISPRKFAALGSTTDSNEPGTMSYAFARLREFSGMGKFYNYQFIGDLAYTHVLRDAPDWFTWSFCGPGTSRGLVRLKCPSGKATLPNGKRLPRMMPLQRGWQEQLLELQAQVNKDLGTETKKGKTVPVRSGGEVRKLEPLHMRDLTNCLCEYDKYERALFNERSIKRPYAGT